MLSQESMLLEEDKFHISAETVNYDDRTKVLNHSDTFAIFDRWGDIHPHTKKAQGIFHKGTRFINRLELRINRKKLLLLSSAIREDNDILSVDLTNPELPACNIPENTIHIARSQFIRNGIYYEEISIANYSDAECSFEMSLSFGADFKDLFEIRGMERTLHPNKPDSSISGDRLFFDYTGLDHIHRRTDISFPKDSNCSIDHNTTRFMVSLKPLDKEKFTYRIAFHTQETFLHTEEDDTEEYSFNSAFSGLQHDLEKINKLFGEIHTSHERFNHWVARSQTDLVSLLTPTPYGLYPYAGVPWYNTAFGRDGIITAMEVLWIAPEIAKNALLFLATHQAKENDPSRDAEPGKILHEARSGEMANTGEVPFKQYYGTIDATPLFIMLAGMYYKQTGDLHTIKQIWPNIKAALEWIKNYGDLDGDGFVEYRHKAENGLTNQGWKDSHDSIMYADGRLCEPPIALCEVQGYVYAAKLHASKLADLFNEKELADSLELEAKQLKQNFNKVFWDESSGCFALALDGDKKPCKVVSSNAGHCLFTGIADVSHAPALARTLSSEKMFSGWGIRTLATNEKRYNPMSYHNGSIWPHDNALIAAGLAAYGFRLEAQTIMATLFDAALFIELKRLPELYCGFIRRPNEGPTSYPVACSPQAWSVSTVFLLLQACLQIEVNAEEKTVLFVNSVLPDFLDKVNLTNIKTGNKTCSVQLYRQDEKVKLDIIQKPRDWKVQLLNSE